MALTSITKDFIVKSGLIVQGTTNPITTSTGNLGTLQVSGGGAFAKDIMVASTATVYGATQLNNTLDVVGNVTVGADKFTIDSSNGNTYADGNVGVLGTFNSTGTLSVNVDKFTVDGATGNITTKGNTYVDGNVGINGTLNSTGTFSVNLDKFTVDGATGNTYVAGNTGIVGTLNSTGTLSVNVDKFTVDGATGNTYVAGNAGVVGTFNSTGTLTVNTDKFIVDGATGNTHVEGTFNVTGTSYLHSTLDVLGVTTLLDSTAGGVGVGALVVKNGGASVKGDLYADSTSTAAVAGGGTGAVRVAGGVYIGDNLIVNSTASDTSTNTTNALYVAGGAWIDKTLHVVGQAVFDNDVYFNGATTYVYSTNTVYTDNIINLHTPPGGVNDLWYGDDGKDVGFLFHYFNSTDTNAALVLANDTHYLEWFQSGDHSNPAHFNSGTYGTFKTGSVKLVDTTAATNTYSGALTVEGGVGIGGDVYIGGNEVVLQDLEVRGGDITTDQATFNLLNTHATTVNFAGSGTTINVGAPTGYVKIHSTDDASNTSTGALRVEGGVGIGKDLYVGGTIHANQIIGFGQVQATVTTATNIRSGLNGEIPIQNGDGSTTFIAAGTGDAQVLTWSAVGTTATWQSASGTSVGNATTATNIAGGQANEIPYQSAPGVTTFSANLTFDGTDLTIGGSGGDITMTNGNITGVNHISATELTAATITATSNLYLTNLTQNSVPYIGASGQVSEDNTNFTWSAVGNILHAANITGAILTATSNVYITGSDASSTTTAAAGALQVTGGVGIGGGLYVDQDAFVNADLYVQGTLYVQGNSLDGVDTITGSTGTFADIVSTGTITANVINVSGVTHSTNATQALYNNTGTGALIVDGGIFSDNNIVASGVIAGGDGVAPGTGLIAEGLYIHNSMQAGGTWAGVSGTTAKTIDTWDKTLYTSAKYIVQVVDSGDVHTQELMVIHDGTDVYISEYGIITTAGELGVFDGVITGGNVVITFIPTGATAMTIQTVRQSVLTNSQVYW